MFQFHLLSLVSRWSPRLPQCASPLLSLSRWSPPLPQCVSPLLSLSRWSPHLPQCVSPLLSLSRWSPPLPQCVSPLLSLSHWSPHLPQRQSTASSSVSVTVRVVIPTATLNESIVNGYRRHSHNSCSRLLPQGLNPANPQVKHVSPVTTTTSSRASLSELNVTVHVLFSASTRPTGQLEGRGAEVTDFTSLRLVD